MMNHDECKHCLCRGDFEACEKAKCSKHHFWYISELKNRHAELVELVKEVRANDCGAWMKECGSVFKCSDGTVKRQELARLLDKLYKVSRV